MLAHPNIHCNRSFQCLNHILQVPGAFLTIENVNSDAQIREIISRFLRGGLAFRIFLRCGVIVLIMYLLSWLVCRTKNPKPVRRAVCKEPQTVRWQTIRRGAPLPTRLGPSSPVNRQDEGKRFS